MDQQKPLAHFPSQEDFETFFENSLNGIIITDSKGVILKQIS